MSLQHKLLFCMVTAGALTACGGGGGSGDSSDSSDGSYLAVTGVKLVNGNPITTVCLNNVANASANSLTGQDIAANLARFYFIAGNYSITSSNSRSCDTLPGAVVLTVSKYNDIVLPWINANPISSNTPRPTTTNPTTTNPTTTNPTTTNPTTTNPTTTNPTTTNPTTTNPTTTNPTTTNPTTTNPTTTNPTTTNPTNSTPITPISCPSGSGSGVNGLSFYSPNGYTSYSLSTTSARVDLTSSLTWGVQYQNSDLPENSYTGSLRAVLWAVSRSYSGGTISGIKLGEYSPNFTGSGAQSANQVFVGGFSTTTVQSANSATSPNRGSYCIVATLEEYSGQFKIVDWVQFGQSLAFQ